MNGTKINDNLFAGLDDLTIKIMEKVVNLICNAYETASNKPYPFLYRLITEAHDIKVSHSELIYTLELLKENPKFRVIKAVDRQNEYGRDASEILEVLDWEKLRLLRQKLSSKAALINEKNIATPTTTKIKVCISTTKGIFLKENSNLTYPIKGKGRIEIIRKLDGKLQVRPELLNPNLPILSKEIGEINKLFKNKLGNLENDLIVHVPTGGYALNYERYEIQFTD